MKCLGCKRIEKYPYKSHLCPDCNGALNHILLALLQFFKISGENFEWDYDNCDKKEFCDCLKEICKQRKTIIG